MKRNKNQNRRVQNELKQSLEKQYLSGKSFCHVDILNENIENQITSQKIRNKILGSDHILKLQKLFSSGNV